MRRYFHEGSGADSHAAFWGNAHCHCWLQWHCWQACRPHLPRNSHPGFTPCGEPLTSHGLTFVPLHGKSAFGCCTSQVLALCNCSDRVRCLMPMESAALKHWSNHAACYSGNLCLQLSLLAVVKSLCPSAESRQGYGRCRCMCRVQVCRPEHLHFPFDVYAMSSRTKLSSHTIHIWLPRICFHGT